MTTTTELVSKRVCVTGGAGFLGRAVCARFHAAGFGNVSVPRSAEFDLTSAESVSRLFAQARPEVVVHLAAEVGGIGANEKRPGRFFYANMLMGVLLIEEARRRGVEKFVQVGTVCSYPKHCRTPFREEDLWNGFPEETNAPYGVAKRALGVMLDAYRREYGFNGVYLLPANLYGPHDNFDAETSHVIPGMIRQFCDAVDQGAERVECWGTGTPTREFLYVDDAADAIVLATMSHDDPEPVNLGTGEEISIRDLADAIARLCGFRGTIAWNPTRPDGQPRRRLDPSRARRRLGWTASVGLEEGLRRTIEWWRAHRPSALRPVAGGSS
ncbi:MAG: GDP-L-fucose synthase [Planctomycetes bacterium]|nr:GDP-L-fucose synthase [Planctomycetota bacterium]